MIGSPTAGSIEKLPSVEGGETKRNSPVPVRIVEVGERVHGQAKPAGTADRHLIGSYDHPHLPMHVDLFGGKPFHVLSCLPMKSIARSNAGSVCVTNSKRFKIENRC